MQDHFSWDANSQFPLRDIQFCMLLHWFTSGQLVITTYLPWNWFLVKNLIFLIYEYLDVRCMFQFLHHNALRWVLKEGWEYMLDMNLHLFYKISWTNNGGFIYSPICWLSLWWVKLPTLGGESKQLEKEII